MRLIALIAGGLVCLNVQAQSVYRCGADGRTYSQVPCAQGRAVDVADSRSPEQRDAAWAQLHDTQSRADLLERERLRREMGSPARATTIHANPVPHLPAAAVHDKRSKKKSKKAKKHSSEDFTATVPTSKGAGRS